MWRCMLAGMGGWSTSGTCNNVIRHVKIAGHMDTLTQEQKNQLEISQVHLLLLKLCGIIYTVVTVFAVQAVFINL